MAGALDAAPFSFRQTADGTVMIAWQGRVVTTLRGRRAAAFLARIDGGDEASRQLAMAKATGNFKRGNERPAHRPRP